MICFLKSLIGKNNLFLLLHEPPNIFPATILHGKNQV